MAGLLVLVGWQLLRTPAGAGSRRAVSQAAQPGATAAADTIAIARLTVTTFALVLLLRIFLNASVHGYGFALAMPATLVLVVALVDWVPASLSARGWDGAVFQASALGAWCMFVSVHIGFMAPYEAGKRIQVGEGVDAFAADARGAPVDAALREIQDRIRSDETMVVMPEGVMLNYLARRVNPTPYLNFMPPELAAFGEPAILAALASRAPDFVVLVHKDTTEYGARFFGREYGTPLLAWVRAHYRVVRLIGAPPFVDDRFGIEVLQRDGS
jgi:hypothetical protein